LLAWPAIIFLHRRKSPYDRFAGGYNVMTIYKLISNGSFGPDEIKVMTEAYEGALIDLGVVNREDPLTELIAKSIVNVTATGERDPLVVKVRAVNALGIRRTSAA
jgi:hypothetical protein